MRISRLRALASLPFLAASMQPALASSTVRIFVVAGQSNAVGAGAAALELPRALQSPQDDVRLWFEIGPVEAIDNLALRVSSGGEFVPLSFQSDAAGRTFGNLLHGFGPEMRLGRALADSLDDDVAIVKFAFNGSDLAHDWNADVPGSLCSQLLRRVRAARTSLANAGYDARVAGLCWMQGESDAVASNDAWKYAEQLTKLIVRVRTELGEPLLPIAIGRVNAFIDSAEGYSLPYLNVVRQQQTFVASNVPYTALVDTDDLSLTADHLHFDASAELALGQRFAAEQLAMTNAGPATAFCFGEGGCPCGNASATVWRSGCSNSLGRGGKLIATGTARVSDDRLTLAVVSVPPLGATQFIEQDAENNLGFGTASGDGLRCLSGRIVRLGMKTGNAAYPSASDPLISVRGMASAGRTLYYQVIYRDDASYCTPSPYNSTNALAITWTQ